MSNYEKIAEKIKFIYENIDLCRVKVRKLQDNHLTDDLYKFYALKSFFDGKVVKFFIDRRSYVRIKEFDNLRKIFGVKKRK